MKNPGNVRDVGDLNGRKVLRVKGSSFFVSPSEGSIVSTDDPLDQLDLLRQQEVLANLHLVVAFPSDTTGRCEVGRIGGERKHVGEGVWVV